MLGVQGTSAVEVGGSLFIFLNAVEVGIAHPRYTTGHGPRGRTVIRGLRLRISSVCGHWDIYKWHSPAKQAIHQVFFIKSPYHVTSSLRLTSYNWKKDTIIAAIKNGSPVRSFN